MRTLKTKSAFSHIVLLIWLKNCKTLFSYQYLIFTCRLYPNSFTFRSSLYVGIPLGLPKLCTLENVKNAQGTVPLVFEKSMMSHFLHEKEKKLYWKHKHWYLYISAEEDSKCPLLISWHASGKLVELVYRDIVITESDLMACLHYWVGLCD